MKSRQILKGQYDELGKFMCNQYLKKHDLFKLLNETQKKVSDMMNEEMPDLVRDAYKAYPGYFEIKSFKATNLGRLFSNHTDDMDERQVYNLKYDYYKRPLTSWSKKRAETSNYIYQKLKEKGLHEVFGSYMPYHAERIVDPDTGKSKSDYDLGTLTFFAVPVGNMVNTSGQSSYYDNEEWRNLVEYLGDHKAILDVIVNYLIEYGKYRNFVKSLSCAFGTITTTNMLKNEIPEAYEYFYSKYGAEYEEQDKREAEQKKKTKKAQCDKVEALRAALS